MIVGFLKRVALILVQNSITYSLIVDELLFAITQHLGTLFFMTLKGQSMFVEFVSKSTSHFNRDLRFKVYMFLLVAVRVNKVLSCWIIIE